MSGATEIIVPVLRNIQAQLGRIKTDRVNIKEDMHHIKVRLTGSRTT